uniref:NADH-ubiquinone oxidoreductase chain 4L n=1 Tax=Crangon hakodatei TaxID=1884866 RepID=A0A1C9CYF5_9EUCA|nr:NADH dehydrogenase subunit 4L [Crangon hakodatei]
MTNLNLLYIIPAISIICGLISFVGNRKHLLNTLLSLEFIMLSIFWFLGVILSSMGWDMYFVLFFLTLAACEGALSLGLLVSCVRMHGNDFFSSINVLQC